MGLIKLRDEGFLERHIEIDSDGKARSKVVQPTRNLILDNNAELRKNPGAVKTLSFMKLAATVPLEDWWNALRRDPELNAPDKEIREKAMQRFLSDPGSAIYRVQ